MRQIYISFLLLVLSSITLQAQNVGIGEASPSTKLSIKGDGSDLLNIQDDAGNPEVYVTKKGNVGIGTVNPNHHLQVNGQIRLGNSSGSDAWFRFYDNGQNQRWGLSPDWDNDKLTLFDYTTGGAKMQWEEGGDTYLNEGDLGIGTTAPVGPKYGSGGKVLDIRESNDDEIAQLYVAGSGQGTGYIYVGQDNSHGGGITYNGNNNPTMNNIASDDISIFRRDNGTDYEVLHWSNNNSTAKFEGDVDMQSNRIKDLSNPVAPSHGATKDYVDSLLSEEAQLTEFVNDNKRLQYHKDENVIRGKTTTSNPGANTKDSRAFVSENSFFDGSTEGLIYEVPFRFIGSGSSNYQMFCFLMSTTSGVMNTNGESCYCLYENVAGNGFRIYERYDNDWNLINSINSSFSADGNWHNAKVVVHPSGNDLFSIYIDGEKLYTVNTSQTNYNRRKGYFGLSHSGSGSAKHEFRPPEINAPNTRFPSDKVVFDGQVGVGTTSPSEQLNVNGGAMRIDYGGNKNLQINATSSFGSYRYQTFEKQGTEQWSFWGDDGGADFTFYDEVNNNEVLVMEQGETVGIGTHSPSATLDVDGATEINGQLNMTGNTITNTNEIESESGAVQPHMVLHSTSSGSDWNDQGAYISIGENGASGDASLHMTYRGDGFGFIGSGTVSNAEPGSSYLRFDYSNDYIYTPDKLEVGALKVDEPSSNNDVLVSDGNGNTSWSDPSTLGPDGGLTNRGTLQKGDHRVSSNNLAAGITTSGDGSNHSRPTDGNKARGSDYLGFGSGSQGGGPEDDYVQIDLGAAQTVSQHKIYFWDEDNRYYWFKLKYSYDGNTWHYAVGNENEWATSAPGNTVSSNNGIGYVTDIRVPSITARYWRIYGDGNTSNSGNHIYEWEIFQEANPVDMEVDDDLKVNGKMAIGSNVSSNYRFYVNGKIGSNGINETSDERFKKNINTIDNAIGKVNRLRGVFYKWRQKEYKDRQFESGRQAGVIAQEVEEVLPEVVDTDKDGYKSVEYTDLTPVLIEAVKELSNENQQIKAKNMQLENQNKQLKQRLNALESKVNRHIDQQKGATAAK